MSKKSACWLGFHISSQKVSPSTPFDHEGNIRLILAEAHESGITLDPTPEESLSREEAATFATQWGEQCIVALGDIDVPLEYEAAFMIGLHAGQLFVNCSDSPIEDKKIPYPSESKLEALRLLNQILQLCFVMRFRPAIRKDIEMTKAKFAYSKTHEEAMDATGYLGAWLIKAFYVPTG